MPTVEQFKTREPSFAVLANSNFGEGKTYFGMTFPKVFYIGFEPHGLDILYQPGNKALLDNLVEYEYVIPDSIEMLKEMLNEDETKGTLLKSINKAKSMAKEGKVKTLFIDNITYMTDLKWKLINEKKPTSPNTGQVDTQSMYSALSMYLDWLFITKILTFPGNVVASCHLKRESEETIQGKKQRAGKVDRGSDVAPAILGSFRDKIAGKFGASIYLERKLQGTNPPKFVAYCNKCFAFGTVIYAKNRYGLPTTVENISYQTLMKYNQTKKETVTV